MISPWVLPLLFVLSAFSFALGMYYVLNAEALATKHRERMVQRPPPVRWPREPIGPRGHRIIGFFVMALSILFIARVALPIVARTGA